jgi:light-regulated signal transduction histidine kinase (bacteriophytochrome)
MAGHREAVQLLQNLIGNAMKYRAADAPVVTASAVRDGSAWRITVRDNGIGIDSSYHERIFVVFQRLHTSDEYPGTGMGLAICKKIVDGYGGSISVASSPGAGSAFTFTLPAKDGE